MSRLYYDVISMKNKKWDDVLYRYNLDIEAKKYFDMVKQTYILLLQIIDNKTDDEFNEFFKKYMYNFHFKKQYLGRIFSVNKDFKVVCENLRAVNYFPTVRDLIEICCFSVIHDKYEFQKELNIFLTDIFNICQKEKPIPATIKRLVCNSNIGEEKPKKQRKNQFQQLLKDWFGIVILVKKKGNQNVCAVKLLI